MVGLSLSGKVIHMKRMHHTSIADTEILLHKTNIAHLQKGGKLNGCQEELNGPS
jgi:hypothetical protein